MDIAKTETGSKRDKASHETSRDLPKEWVYSSPKEEKHLGREPQST